MLQINFTNNFLTNYYSSTCLYLYPGTFFFYALCINRNVKPFVT